MEEFRDRIGDFEEGLDGFDIRIEDLFVRFGKNGSGSSDSGSGDDTDDSDSGGEKGDSGEGDSRDRTECKAVDRIAELCTQEYDPVCGWNDPTKVVCVTYPCASTYSNGCSACRDPNVGYYTKGVCPSVDGSNSI